MAHDLTNPPQPGTYLALVYEWWGTPADRPAQPVWVQKIYTAQQWVKVTYHYDTGYAAQQGAAHEHLQVVAWLPLPPVQVPPVVHHAKWADFYHAVGVAVENGYTPNTFLVPACTVVDHDPAHATAGLMLLYRGTQIGGHTVLPVVGLNTVVAVYTPPGCTTTL